MIGRSFELWLYKEVHGRSPKRMQRSKRRETPWRNARYRAWIRTLPSCISGRIGCEAAHTGTDGGMRQKASDFTCVPLTPEEHREYHSIGRRAMEKKYGVSFASISRKLFGVWKEYGGLVK
jgi:Protein of unknown function (DUF968)